LGRLCELIAGIVHAMNALALRHFRQHSLSIDKRPLCWRYLGHVRREAVYLRLERVHTTLDLQKALGMLFIGIPARHHPVHHPFIHDEPPLGGQGDLDPVEGARRRSLIVRAGPVKAAPMAGTLELVVDGNQFGVHPKWVQMASRA